MLCQHGVAHYPALPLNQLQLVPEVAYAQAPEVCLESFTLQIEPESMAKHEVAPLLEVQLELVVPDIVWLPELSSDASARGVRDMLNTWLKSFLDIATLIKRLDTGEGGLS